MHDWNNNSFTILWPLSAQEALHEKLSCYTDEYTVATWVQQYFVFFTLTTATKYKNATWNYHAKRKLNMNRAETPHKIIKEENVSVSFTDQKITNSPCWMYDVHQCTQHGWTAYVYIQLKDNHRLCTTISVINRKAAVTVVNLPLSYVLSSNSKWVHIYNIL